METETTDRLADALAGIMKDRGLRLATAESCTGGEIAARLSRVPDAATFFSGGVVAYSVEAKVRLLGLPPSLLRGEGTVSGHVAEAMASSVRRILCSDVGVAATGVVGDATEGKPPGLIYVGVAIPGRIIIRERSGDEGSSGNMVAAIDLALQASLDALSTPGPQRP